jgi:hypothetical protein
MTIPRRLAHAPAAATLDVVVAAGDEHVALSDDDARILVCALLAADDAGGHRLAGSLCRARATRSRVPVRVPADAVNAVAAAGGAQGATPALALLAQAAG